MKALPTGLIVKCNFLYLLPFCFFLRSNSLVRLSEECNVVGHGWNGMLSHHENILYWGSLNGVSIKRVGERS